MKKYYILIVSIILSLSVKSQTITNGSVTGGPAGNSLLSNALGWLDCGGSPDLCDVNFPSYSGNSTVTVSPSPDGGAWIGIAGISVGECAKTNITGLIPGQCYSLNFYGANFGSGSTILSGSPAEPRICVGTTCQTYTIPLVTNTWNSYQLDFIATSTSATLKLSYQNPNNLAYASLDGFTLTTPCANISPLQVENDTVCPSSSTTLHASGGNGSFTWYKLNNPIDTLSNNDSLSIVVDSTSLFVVTDGFTYDTAQVFVNHILAYAGNDTSICNGNSIIIGNSGIYESGTNFIWTPDSSLNDPNIANPVANPLISTKYILTTSNNSCTAMDTVFVSVSTGITAYDTLYICKGESIMIHGSSVDTSGTYIQTYPRNNNCDSTSIITLNVNSISIDTLSISICSGESYYTGGSYHSISGLYIDSLMGNSGCDSIIITQLTVNTIKQSIDSIFICQGESVIIFGNIQSNQGTYIDTIQNINGCDSIAITKLFVLPYIYFTDTIYSCPGESVQIHGETQTTPGTYIDTFQTSFGCDSIAITELIVLPYIYFTDTIYSCPGVSVQIHGKTQTTPGTYIDTIQNLNGCDSIAITELIVLPYIYFTDTIYSCPGESVQIHGKTQITPGTYIDTIQNLNGCDSIAITELIVLPYIYFIDTIYSCPGESVQIHGKTQATPGTYIDTMQNLNGCDSISFITLLNFDTYQVSNDYKLCEGDTIIINNNIYSNEGSYSDTFATINGCDSIVTSNIFITVKPQLELGDDIDLCEGEDTLIGSYSLPSGMEIIWNDGNNQEQRFVNSPGLYIMQISDSICPGVSDSIRINTIDCDNSIFVPNAFSPNADGMNDIFIPVYKGEFDAYILRVYDRWGAVIFESRDIKFGWDGYFKNSAMSVGTYIWTISYNNSNKLIRENLSGSVVLIK